MEIIKSTIKLNNVNGQNVIHIDCGKSYYTGIVNEDNFLPEFRDNYLEILEKSFIGYTDESVKIMASLEFTDLSADNNYVINIYMKNKFYSLDKEIKIPLSVSIKDRFDYLEEKVTTLTSMVEELEKKIAYMTTKSVMNGKEIDNESEDETSIQEDNITSDNDSQKNTKKEKSSRKGKNIIAKSSK